MGYKRARNTTLLKWAEGNDLHGLEVELAELTVDRWLAINRLSAELQALERKGSSVELADKAGEFFSAFAGALVSWNLEDDQGPVPADRVGVGAQGLNFVLKLAMAWIGAAGSVDTPLPNGSANGHGAGVEASMPMASPPSPPGS